MSGWGVIDTRNQAAFSGEVSEKEEGGGPCKVVRALYIFKKDKVGSCLTYLYPWICVTDVVAGGRLFEWWKGASQKENHSEKSAVASSEDIQKWFNSESGKVKKATKDFRKDV